MKDSFKIIFGIVLLLIGMTLLLENLGVYLPVDVWNVFGTFWPLVFVYLGIKLLMENKVKGGIALVLLGSLMILSNLFNLDFFSILWPLFIIWLGFTVIFKEERVNSISPIVDDSDFIKESIVFWGSEKKLKSKVFKGGEINVAMGGMEIDMTEAKIDKGGAKLNLNLIMGGLEIRVPKDCKVVVNGTGILGGWENNTVTNDGVNAPVLEITGTVILGGVEIRQ